MKWLMPICGAGELKKSRRLMPDTSRPVVVDGKSYRSITAAASALGVSQTKIYRKIGEAWRFAK
jgi:hypothetical protein